MTEKFVPIVVVIDPEEIVRSLIRDILMRRLGWDVVHMAADGVEGYRLIKENIPGLVIAEVKMPKLDGVELLDKIREVAGQSIKVILMSADEEGGEEAIEHGADAILFKPFDPDAFIDTIQRVMG